MQAIENEVGQRQLKIDILNLFQSNWMNWILVFINLFHKKDCLYFRVQTARPISANFCTDLHTNSGKVLTTSMILPSHPPNLGVPQTPKPKQVTGEKSLCNANCPDGYLYTV